MKATLEQLRKLRITLEDHQLKHHDLISEMQHLRRNCRELRDKIIAARRVRVACETEESECGLPR